MTDADAYVPEQSYIGAYRIRWSPNGQLLAAVVSLGSFEPEFQGHKLLLADKDTLNFTVLHADGWPLPQESAPAVIAWSRNNTLYATFSNTVRVYTPDGLFTEFALSDFPAYRHAHSISITTDQSQLALLSHDRALASRQRLTLHDLETLQPLVDMTDQLPPLVSWIEFSPDGRFFVVLGFEGLRIWAIYQKRYEEIFSQSISRSAAGIAWSWDSQLLACGGTSVNVFRVSDWKVIATFDDKPKGLGSGLFCFSPNNQWLIRGGTAYHLYDNRRETITDINAVAGDLSQEGLGALGIWKFAEDATDDWIRNQNFGSFFHIVQTKLD